MKKLFKQLPTMYATGKNVDSDILYRGLAQVVFKYMIS